MPTNRKRKMRTSRRVPLNITPEYIRKLKLRDFMGALTEEEIPIAKEAGIFKWDAWAKERRESRGAYADE